MYSLLNKHPRRSLFGPCPFLPLLFFTFSSHFPFFSSLNVALFFEKPLLSCAIAFFPAVFQKKGGATGARRSLSFLLLSSFSSSPLSSLGGYIRRAHWILASVPRSSFSSSYYTRLSSFLRLHLALGLDPTVAPNSPARHPSHTTPLYRLS